MRVNIYAEEMTNKIEIITKEIEGTKFTGLRFYLELPVTANDYEKDGVPVNIKGPFIHHIGDDDSAAVTFWGKTDLRRMLRQALALLDSYYSR